MFPREHFASATDLIGLLPASRDPATHDHGSHYGASRSILLLMPEHARAAKEIVNSSNALQKAQINVQSKVLSFPVDAQGLDQLLGQVVRMALDKEPNESVFEVFNP